MAFAKLDNRKKGFVEYAKVKDMFDGSKHPEVCNGKKNEEEAIAQFIEVYDIHHNSFNDYQKQDKVTQEEFIQYYRIVSANYDNEAAFINMVKGVWGIKFETPDVSERDWAGGKDKAGNHRERYRQENMKGTPFGTSS